MSYTCLLDNRRTCPTTQPPSNYCLQQKGGSACQIDLKRRSINPYGVWLWVPKEQEFCPKCRDELYADTRDTLKCKCGYTEAI